MILQSAQCSIKLCSAGRNGKKRGMVLHSLDDGASIYDLILFPFVHEDVELRQKKLRK
jgi:hypothetical protein